MTILIILIMIMTTKVMMMVARRRGEGCHRISENMNSKYCQIVLQNSNQGKTIVGNCIVLQIKLVKIIGS